MATSTIKQEIKTQTLTLTNYNTIWSGMLKLDALANKKIVVVGSNLKDEDGYTYFPCITGIAQSNMAPIGFLVNSETGNTLHSQKAMSGTISYFEVP